jgi:hypothetical protein
MHSPVALDRWERLLQARGGYRKRKCGKYTKPGPRPRAMPVVEEERTVPMQIRTIATDSPTYLYTTPLYLPDGSSTWPVSINSSVTSNSYPTTSTIFRSSLTAASSSITTNYIPLTVNNYIISNYFRDENSEDTNYYYYYPRVAPLTEEQQKEIDKLHKKAGIQFKLKSQLRIEAPRNKKNEFVRAALSHAQFDIVPENEITALGLLKSMLSPDEWRRYLTYGFIVIRGQSGLEYKIARNKSHVVVFKKGQIMAELCVSVNGGVPPSDAVIARKILIEVDEKDIWARANVHMPAPITAKLIGGVGYRTPQLTEDQLKQLAA